MQNQKIKLLKERVIQHSVAGQCIGRCCSWNFSWIITPLLAQLCTIWLHCFASAAINLFKCDEKSLMTVSLIRMKVKSLTCGTWLIHCCP